MSALPGAAALAGGAVHETPRLRLRLFRESDVPALAAIFADPESMQYIGEGKTFTADETWRSIAGMLGHWAIRGYGMWALERRDTGEMIGRVGFIDPAGWPGFELGWHVAKPLWGQGYATEAARFALDHARRVLGRDRVISLIRPGNTASVRVAEKIGMRLDGEVELLGSRALRYAAGAA